MKLYRIRSPDGQRYMVAYTLKDIAEDWTIESAELVASSAFMGHGPAEVVLSPGVRRQVVEDAKKAEEGGT